MLVPGSSSDVLYLINDDSNIEDIYSASPELNILTDIDSGMNMKRELRITSAVDSSQEFQK